MIYWYGDTVILNVTITTSVENHLLDNVTWSFCFVRCVVTIKSNVLIELATWVVSESPQLNDNSLKATILLLYIQQYIKITAPIVKVSFTSSTETSLRLSYSSPDRNAGDIVGVF